jgi:Inner membrane component of T3SS, cytoplasmic domain
VSEDRRKLVITDADLPPVSEEAAARPPFPPSPAAPGTPVSPSAGVPLPTTSLTTQIMAPPAAAPGQTPSASQAAPWTAAAPGTGTGWFGSTMGLNLTAGVLAALVAWGICELIFGEELWFNNLVGHEATYFGVFGLLFAGIFAAWEDVIARTWEKAARNGAIGAAIGAVLGATSGAVAQWVYETIIKNIAKAVIEGRTTVGPTDVRLDLARALGWGILGLGVGLGAGIARGSANKTINALVGGVIGGFVGGFLFNFIAKATESSSTSRFLTSLITGVLIGAAVGLIEVARRQAWLQIIAGGMNGKEFILYWPSANIGSSAKAEITLVKDPSIAPYHFRIDTQGNRRTLTAYEGCPLAVNGQPTAQHWLHSGDRIQLGSSTLLYSERAVQR